MSTDPTIRQQTYPYFLQEAPELLQSLEQGLLSLQSDCSINTIHTLMRTTHTLKGAAASVGLETIASIAHSLEDIFKAFCRPDVSIDPEVQALLFQGYECLALPLSTELAGGSIDDTEVLNRATAVFSQLHERLGPWLDQEVELPNSAGLGFDMTQSMFEVGVSQRLEQLAAAIGTTSPEELATVLRTQAEVFFGLAESLDLPGFGQIAQATLTALDRHPDQVQAIAEQAVASFREGQAAVLAGDRRLGGSPSPQLQHWAGAARKKRPAPPPPPGSPIETALRRYSATHKAGTAQGRLHQLWQRMRGFLLGADAVEADAAAPSPPTEPPAPVNPLLTNPLLANVWGQAAPEEAAVEATSPVAENPPEPAHLLVTTRLEPSQSTSTLLLHPQAAPPPAAKKPSRSPVVRVPVEHLEQLSYAVGELLTNQNRQLLQHEQLQESVQILLKRLQQHQKLLNQLQDRPDRTSAAVELPVAIPDVVSTLQSDRFDALELDRYSSADLLVQSLLDDTVQLAEATEAIDLFTRQSSQLLEKQRLLLAGARTALLEARMLPLGQIFSRFPAVLQQMETLHNKQVRLSLQGSEVLVDKVVAEKLYEPLLHLIRNAFDHGIEAAPLRQQRGKPKSGQLLIRAYYQGRYLLIDVQDDGEGLNFERIRQRSIEYQLVSPDQARRLNQAQLIDLLFEPGFSTASQVNTLSGRGVGLDVVRNQLQALQGSITVYSESQQGTTFTLQIPLGLTIAKLIICQAGGKTYALLADAVEQILLPQASQIQERDRARILWWNSDAEEQLAALYALSEMLDYGPLTLDRAPPLVAAAAASQPNYVILVRCLGAIWGLEVDQLLGEQELVIRPLETTIAAPSYIQGASTLADGQLTLVIDAAALIQQKAFDQKQEPPAPAPDAEAAAGRLPFQRQPQAPLQLQATLVSPAGRSSPKILIIDDSITTRQTLALTLQKAGYQVLQAKDGYEAIEQLQHQMQIQLVICDLEMPRMNGFEFLSYRQRQPALATVPVVILTSRSSEKHRVLALQLGATAYITKPYIEHKLLATIAEAIETSESVVPH